MILSHLNVVVINEYKTNSIFPYHPAKKITVLDQLILEKGQVVLNFNSPLIKKQYELMQKGKSNCFQYSITSTQKQIHDTKSHGI